MITYLAFLRGINVGGKNIVKMADLKRLFESIGFTGVQTYIQSGNVIFCADEGEDAIRLKIEREIKSYFGFPVSVILRTDDELRRLIGNLPFTREQIAEAELSTDTECLYVALLNEAPSREVIKRLTDNANGDQLQVVGRDAYLLLRRSIRDSKLAVNLTKIDIPYTVRNWKTIKKIGKLIIV